MNVIGLIPIINYRRYKFRETITREMSVKCCSKIFDVKEKSGAHTLVGGYGTINKSSGNDTAPRNPTRGEKTSGSKAPRVENKSSSRSNFFRARSARNTAAGFILRRDFKKKRGGGDKSLEVGLITRIKSSPKRNFRNYPRAFTKTGKNYLQRADVTLNAAPDRNKKHALFFSPPIRLAFSSTVLTGLPPTAFTPRRFCLVPAAGEL